MQVTLFKRCFLGFRWKAVSSALCRTHWAMNVLFIQQEVDLLQNIIYLSGMNNIKEGLSDHQMTQKKTSISDEFQAWTK